jgi:hypothetical protein
MILQNIDVVCNYDLNSNYQMSSKNSVENQMLEHRRSCVEQKVRKLCTAAPWFSVFFMRKIDRPVFLCQERPPNMTSVVASSPMSE